MVPFKVTFDVPEIVYQSMSQELTGLGGFFWQGYNQGAQYLFRNKIHMDQASQWADKSIEIQKTFPNLQLKAKMLEAKGDKEMAANLRTESLTLGDEAQINAYGYELIAAKNYAEANQIFAMNVKKFPNSWNVYDSLGETQIEQGNKKDGLSNYKKALSKAPDAQKARIEGIIKHIEAK